MARYGVEHKAETRRRIIEAAGRRLKQHGIDGSGIAAVMSDADLTNGAFYAHFGSKSDLVANVVTDQLERQRASIGALPADRDSLEDYIRAYLSTEHRDDHTGGCPTAALLSEIGRCDATVRDAYSEGAQSIVQEIAAHLPPGRSDTNRLQTALGLFSILVTSLQLARAISDPALSDQVLDTGIHNALRILDDPA
ncbi:TetR/AcrR family transcriptional regulator [Nocardia vinacea]|uniref:TetR/AcrR family transcriptional regulator n=1 Tax=Nocardia vinacea TaxID=96468 RepID=UPI0002E02760|nr:TetR/AcrR family transcriptional regulator [Nocardia vinacea]